MFEKATRMKLRFATPQGQLTVEDLWDLPLESKNGRANLKDIAIDLSRQLKTQDDVPAFIQTEVSTPATAVIQLKFDIVKKIYEVKVAEKQAADSAAETKAFNQRILELIANKKDEELQGKSIEELQAMLKK